MLSSLTWQFHLGHTMLGLADIRQSIGCQSITDTTISIGVHIHNYFQFKVTTEPYIHVFENRDRKSIKLKERP